MKPLEFLVWCRDVVKSCPGSKEGNKLGKPSNGELRRWIRDEAVFCNGKFLTLQDEVEWPIETLVFFPRNEKARCTIMWPDNLKYPKKF